MFRNNYETKIRSTNPGAVSQRSIMLVYERLLYTMNTTRKTVLSLLITLVGITVCYTASAIQAFTNIGQGPVGAFQLTASYVTGIQMGIIAILFQGVFFLGQIILEKKNWKPRQLLQMLVTVYGGFVLNFVLYTLLDGIVLHSYLLKMLLFIAATAANAFGVSIILNAGFIRVPMEGFLMLLGQKIHISIGRLKQIADLSILVIVLLLTIAFHYNFTVREGTVVNALLFGYCLDAFHKPVSRFLQKHQFTGIESDQINN